MIILFFILCSTFLPYTINSSEKNTQTWSLFSLFTPSHANQRLTQKANTLAYKDSSNEDFCIVEEKDYSTVEFALSSSCINIVNLAEKETLNNIHDAIQATNIQTSLHNSLSSQDLFLQPIQTQLSSKELSVHHSQNSSLASSRSSSNGSLSSNEEIFVSEHGSLSTSTILRQKATEQNPKFSEQQVQIILKKHSETLKPLTASSSVCEIIQRCFEQLLSCASKKDIISRFSMHKISKTHDEPKDS